MAPHVSSRKGVGFASEKCGHPKGWPALGRAGPSQRTNCSEAVDTHAGQRGHKAVCAGAASEPRLAASGALDAVDAEGRWVKGGKKSRRRRPRKKTRFQRQPDLH